MIEFYIVNSNTYTIHFNLRHHSLFFTSSIISVRKISSKISIDHFRFLM